MIQTVYLPNTNFLSFYSFTYIKKNNNSTPGNQENKNFTSKKTKVLRMKN